MLSSVNSIIEEVKVENPKERMHCFVLVCPVLTPLLSKPKQYFFLTLEENLSSCHFS